MCGITGFIDRSQSNESAQNMIGRMLEEIVHRGPDSEGRLVRSELGLYAGMRRLSIIDLAGGEQPIWNEDKSIAVLYNGEIYNFRELRRELETKGHVFRTDSDTEVLVHLYEEEGPGLFGRLRGMFAFSLFDFQAQKMILARDHFGQKPLYYHQGRSLVWGSELKSVLCHSGVTREQDPRAFEEYVVWLKVASGRTHFRDIQKLPPAHYLECNLRTGDVTGPIRYWRYPTQSSQSMRESEAVDRLHELLHESLKLHLRMDVPLGILLSGGLDSRTIAFYAQQHLDQKVRTYTIGYEGDGSEFEAAEETAREIGSVGHTSLSVTPELFRDTLPDVAWHLDEPVGDPAAFAVRQICFEARKDVKVLLSGEGADELFGGYVYSYQGGLQSLQRWESFQRWTRGLIPSPRRYPHFRWERFLYAAGLSRPGWIAYQRQLGFPGDVRCPRGLNRSQLNQLSRLSERVAAVIYQEDSRPLMELTAFDIEWQLAESLLQKADKMSMSASIELRCPFLDVELAEFASALPSEFKLSPGGIGKYVQRKTLAKYFQEDMSRPKKGFPIPLQEWFQGPLREMVEDIVLSSTAKNQDYLDQELLKEAWRDFLDNQWDGAYMIYSLLLYEIWYDRIVARA